MTNLIERVQGIIEEPEIEDSKAIAKQIISLIREDGNVFDQLNATVTVDYLAIKAEKDNMNRFTDYLKARLAREIAEVLISNEYINFDSWQDNLRQQTTISASVKVLKKS